MDECAAYRTLLKHIKLLKMTEHRLMIRIQEKSPTRCWVEILVSVIESLLVLAFLCHVPTEAELPALSFVMKQPPFSAFCFLKHTEYRGKLHRGSIPNVTPLVTCCSVWPLRAAGNSIIVKFSLKKRKSKEIKWWLIRRDGSLLPSLHFSIYFFPPVSIEGAATEETLRCSKAAIREQSYFKDGLILFRFW